MSDDNILSEIGLAVCGSLSMISTTILILYYIFNKKMRTFGFRLVLPLFVFDFIWSFNVGVPTYIFLIDSSEMMYLPLCRLQGTFKLFSMLASFFSTAAISWSIYTFIIRKKPIKTKDPINYFAKYIIILPLFLAIIPLALDRYDHIEPLKNMQCFLVLREDDGQTDYIGVLLRIFLYYIPFWAVLVFDMFVVYKIQRYLKQNHIDYHQMHDIKTLMLYPVILFFSWIWIIIERVAEIFTIDDDSNNNSWLNHMDLSFATLNGFLNALVYGFISLDIFGLFTKRTNSDFSLQSEASLSEGLSMESSKLNTPMLTPSNTKDNNNISQSPTLSEEYSLKFHVNPQDEGEESI